MSSVVEASKEWYDVSQKWVGPIVDGVRTLTQQVHTIPNEELADTVYRLREAAEAFDTMRKRIERLQTVIGLSKGLSLTEEGLTSIPAGELARARVHTTTAPKVPSRTKDPEGYAAICKALGVEDHSLTRVHFPSLKAKVSEIVNGGGQVPEALKQFESYSELTIVVTAINKVKPVTTTEAPPLDIVGGTTTPTAAAPPEDDIPF